MRSKRSAFLILARRAADGRMMRRAFASLFMRDAKRGFLSWAAAAASPLDVKDGASNHNEQDNHNSDNDAGGAAVQEDAAHQVRGVRSSEVNMEARRDCHEDSRVASKLEDDYSCCWPGRSAP